MATLFTRTGAVLGLAFVLAAPACDAGGDPEPVVNPVVQGQDAGEAGAAGQEQDASAAGQGGSAGSSGHAGSGQGGQAGSGQGGQAGSAGHEADAAAGQAGASGDSGVGGNGGADAAAGAAGQPDGGSAGSDPTLNTGDTSGDQAASGQPGAPCDEDSNCKNDSEQDAICLTAAEGFPGGYCSFMTSEPASENYGCNAFGGVAVPYSNNWGDGYCYHRCDAPNDCRVDYRCVGGACMPDCARFVCSVGVCDQQSWVCVAD